MVGSGETLLDDLLTQHIGLKIPSGVTDEVGSFCGNRGVVEAVGRKISVASLVWSISAMEYGTALAIVLWDLIVQAWCI